MNTQTVQELPNLKPVQPLQISQINFDGMILDGIIKSGDPVEPLVAAEIQETPDGSFINIRIVVFVPRALLGQEPISLFQDFETEKNELKFVVKCNSDELISEKYYSWYVNYMHPILDGDPQIDTITTRLEDLIPDYSNPKTKRGTITRVLQS